LLWAFNDVVDLMQHCTYLLSLLSIEGAVQYSVFWGVIPFITWAFWVIPKGLLLNWEVEEFFLPHMGTFMPLDS